MHRIFSTICLFSIALPVLAQVNTRESHEEWLKNIRHRPPSSRGIIVPRRSTATPLFPVIKVNQFVTTEPQNEPSVRINPTNRNNIVAAYRDFRLGGANPAIRNVGLAATTDGGNTWTEQLAQFSNHDRFTDPAVGVDMEGHFYVVTLDYLEQDGFNLATLSVRKSFDGGITWVPALSTDPPGFHDKEMITVDDVPTSPYANNVYISYNGGGQRLTSSTDEGGTFSTPVDISAIGAYSTPITGTHGEIYVVALGAAVNIIKSTDGGSNFNAPVAVSGDFEPDLVFIDGILSIGEPVVAVDKSGSSRRGTIYVTWQSTHLGDGDIFCTASDDSGTSWRPPIRVNTDSLGNGLDQFHHWMTVDDSGWIDVVFLDRRNDPANIFCDAYLAQSRDGGWTFKNYRLTAQNFDPLLYPSSDARLGDYMGIDARLGRIVPIWVDTHLGDQDIYIAVIDSVPVGNSTIAGFAYNDVNMNGIGDAGDSVLAFWPIYLAHDGEIMSTRTDAQGHYSFGDLQPGAYFVSQNQDSGWFQTFPAPVSSYSLNIGTGENLQDNVFLNVRPANANFTAVSAFGGWNLLSIPRVPSNNHVNEVFPTASSPAFLYSGKYVAQTPPNDTLPPGIGFWLKFPSPATRLMLGDSVTGIHVDVRANWNIIGAPVSSIPVGDITSTPPGIISSPFYSYEGGSYLVRTTLKPGLGYWVKTNQAGSIFLSPPSEGIAQDSEPKRDVRIFNSITFEDAEHRHTSLYFTKGDGSMTSGRYELPPKPPAGSLDVRFASQQNVELLPPHSAQDIILPIEIQASSWPLRVTWNIIDDGRIYFLESQNREAISSLERGRVLVLTTEAQAVLTLVSHEILSPAHTPESFSLHANYPNPFNPSTTIGFDLGDEALVTVRVYNVLGVEVATLIDKEKIPAGHQELRFAQTDLPSGVYYCRMIALGTGANIWRHESGIKMVLIK